MYDTNTPYIVVSINDTSKGFGGAEKRALIKLKTNLKRAIIEKTKRKQLNAGKKLCILLFFTFV